MSIDITTLPEVVRNELAILEDRAARAEEQLALADAQLRERNTTIGILQRRCECSEEALRDIQTLASRITQRTEQGLVDVLVVNSGGHPSRRGAFGHQDELGRVPTTRA